MIVSKPNEPDGIMKRSLSFSTISAMTTEDKTSNISTADDMILVSASRFPKELEAISMHNTFQTPSAIGEAKIITELKNIAKASRATTSIILKEGSNDHETKNSASHEYLRKLYTNALFHPSGMENTNGKWVVLYRRSSRRWPEDMKNSQTMIREDQAEGEAFPEKLRWGGHRKPFHCCSYVFHYAGMYLLYAWEVLTDTWEVGWNGVDACYEMQ